MKAQAASLRGPVNTSTVHVFEVLRIVCSAEAPVGVADIARRLGLPTTTVHRALITLEETQYISRYQNSSRYEPGLMPHLLNWTLFRRFALSSAAAPLLRRLAGETGETVSLTVRIGWYGLRVAVVFGGNDIYHRDRLGQTTLLQQELGAKIILANLPDRDFERYRRFVKLQHPEAALKLDRSALRRELRLAQELGYAAEELPVSPGRAAVSVPVRDAAGAVMAAITVNGPVLSLTDAGSQSMPWLAVRDALEVIVRDGGERFSPLYGHFDPDRIAIRLVDAA
jgi:DNA-binding IclR family transcriptional regulator